MRSKAIDDIALAPSTFGYTIPQEVFVAHNRDYGLAAQNFKPVSSQAMNVRISSSGAAI